MRCFLKSLALVAFALGARAEAVGLSIDGVGEAVLLPYYTAAGGRASVISLANHDDAPSAVRVVVAEGRNGRVALSFNVYLAANDAWHAAIVGSDEPSPPMTPRLVTSDSSCTSAVIPAAGVVLRSDAFTGSRDDGLGAGVGRLFSGQVEVIELGRLTGAAAALVQARDCVALRERFATNGAWSVDPNTDMIAPEGRLAAGLSLVDVAAGVAFDTEPLVLQGFSAGPRHGRGDTDFQAVRIFKPTEKNAQGDFDVFYGTVEGDRPADAISLLLSSVTVEMPYSVERTLDASTQAIVTFPTRPAYLDNRPGGEFTGAPRAPFQRFNQPAPDCEADPFAAMTIDRDGTIGPERALRLCEQVNVVQVQGQAAAMPVSETGFDAGNVAAGLLRVSFDATPPHTITYTSGPVTNNTVGYGLPVMAFSLIEVRNANAQPGRLASYAMTGRAVRRRDGIVDF